MYANVIVEIGAKSVDKYFIYKIPKSLENNIKIGIRVKVPFGYQIIEGFVIQIINNYNNEENIDIKEINALVDEYPILNDEMMQLANFISDKTLCSKINAYQAMLPKALKASHNTNINIKMTKYLYLNKNIKIINEYIDKCHYPKQVEILNKLIKDKELKITTINSSIKTLLKHELVKIISKEEYRYKANTISEDKKITLNKEQQACVEEVTNNLDKSITYLLYGITGSGKTEVYMNIINNVINKNKTAILLVPEISLTPQIVSRFLARFKKNIAILHSGLTDTQRYDEYRKIVEQKVNIVIGARSAIFAPLKNIGVIIIDEEHTGSYKQDSNPRYNAIEVAQERSKYHNCPLILGSATPKLESFAKAANKVYKLLTLTKRAGNATLPKTYIIDMKQEVKKKNFIFSDILKEKINDRLQKKEQIILLLNRRGYSSMLTCRNCGNVEKCTNCDISLTYHKTSNNLRCHYCGYSKKKINICSNCGSNDIKDYGLGTEKLVEELQMLFKEAKIIRMDADTTSKRGSHEKITKDFLDNKYDILVGTQMIAKGLDFPKVTLVGVINADASLNVADFRSAEKTFDLLSQVSGRAGRNDITGEVIIQTYNEKHYSILYAATHNYLGFYKEEMKLRKTLGYPPYYYMITIKINTKDYELGFKHANKIKEYLKNKVDKTSIVLGPTMANVFKINNIYNYQCIIKYRYDNLLYKALKEIDEHYKKESKVDIYIDVD